MDFIFFLMMLLMIVAIGFIVMGSMRFSEIAKQITSAKKERSFPVRIKLSSDSTFSTNDAADYLVVFDAMKSEGSENKHPNTNFNFLDSSQGAFIQTCAGIIWYRQNRQIALTIFVVFFGLPAVICLIIFSANRFLGDKFATEIRSHFLNRNSPKIATNANYSLSSELERLNSLYKQGALSEPEFQQAKTSLLSKQAA